MSIKSIILTAITILVVVLSMYNNFFVTIPYEEITLAETISDFVWDSTIESILLKMASFDSVQTSLIYAYIFTFFTMLAYNLVCLQNSCPCIYIAMLIMSPIYWDIVKTFNEIDIFVFWFLCVNSIFCICGLAVLYHLIQAAITKLN